MCCLNVYAMNSNERLNSLATCGRPLNDTVLDLMLGKGHVALLRRAELKMFVDFHGNELIYLARNGGDLTPDEITIIVGALELMEKTAKDAMTPILKAFSLDLDGTLNLWVNFYLEKGNDKSRNDTLPIKMVDELPQQFNDSVLQGYLDVCLLLSRTSLSGGLVIRSFMLFGTIHDVVFSTGRIIPDTFLAKTVLRTNENNS
ncbi:hypothetical protein T459_20212 [Capsicum annuum]|uniref:Uncharacterized protein n=1 Tax=Capsicum annuum TaxID=4072 RepID=A0A2G2Z3U4_CAPAN|nr:hypothetical protein T459_20212 [Capsicum annuum]